MATTIPTLPGVFLLGNLPEFRRSRLDLLMRCARECGGMARIKLINREIFVLTDPELARAVLVKEADGFRKFVGLAKYSRPMLGNGLVTSEGAVHRRQRKLIAPGLKRKQIANYVDQMARWAAETVDGWTDGATIDVHAEMTRLTLGIAAETMFSSTASQHAKLVGDAVHVSTAYTATEMGRPIHVPMSWPTPRNRGLQRAIGALDAIVWEMIRERRRDPGAGDDILSMLLEAQDEDDGSTMTDEQVRDEVMTLLVAGHETLANALSWSLYLVASHPDVAKRLADEALGQLGGRVPKMEDLAQLPYAMQVFKEAMRLYPPVYLLGRETTREVTLGEVTLPPDSTVIISIFGMHRRPDLYPDPERFDPDRFLPEREKALPRDAYLPFADGPRVCVGNHFALMEGQIVLSHMAQHLRFETTQAEAPVPFPQITLRPRDPILLRVTRA